MDDLWFPDPSQLIIVTGPKEEDPWGTPDDQPRKKPRASVPRVDNLDEDQHHERSLGSKRVHPLSGHHDSILVADHDPCDISQFQSWAEWQTKFNEKEKSDKWQFANTFNKNIEAKREDFGDLFDRCHNELYGKASPRQMIDGADIVFQ